MHRRCATRLWALWALTTRGPALELDRLSKCATSLKPRFRPPRVGFSLLRDLLNSQASVSQRSDHPGARTRGRSPWRSFKARRSRPSSRPTAARSTPMPARWSANNDSCRPRSPHRAIRPSYAGLWSLRMLAGAERCKQASRRPWAIGELCARESASRLGDASGPSSSWTLAEITPYEPDHDNACEGSGSLD